MSGLRFLDKLHAASDAQRESIGATGDSRRSAPQRCRARFTGSCWERFQ
jgi:hypothetical protein